MRAVNYLDYVGTSFGVDRKTMVVIDRSLAEAGLRAKGKGSAIPAPSLRDELNMMLAINSDFPAIRAGEGAAYYGSLKLMPSGQTLVEFLEDFVRKAAVSGEIDPCEVVLNHTSREVYVDVGPWGDQQHYNFRSGAIEAPSVSRAMTVTEARASSGMATKYTKISGQYIEALAVRLLRGEY